METQHCCLCSGAMKCGIMINEENRTTHSKIDLLMFLMILLDESKDNLQNNNVCISCFEIINELDFAKERSKELTHILLNFWNIKKKYAQPVIVKQELIDGACDETSYEKQFEENNLLQSDVHEHQSLFDDNEVQIKVENQDDEIKSIIVEEQTVKEEVDVEEQIVQQEIDNIEVKSTKRKRKPSQRLYSCEVCAKQFKANKNLKIHMGVHTEYNAFVCDICNKSFNNKVYLDRHKITHKDIFPYSCDICKRKFKHHSSLTTHKLSHTENRIFECNVCNHNFKSKMNLRNHVNDVHIGEYQYQCLYCDRKFKRPSHLQRHYQTHMTDKDDLHFCSICGGGFNSKENLKKHILAIHKDKSDSKENIANPAKSNSISTQGFVEIKNKT